MKEERNIRLEAEQQIIEAELENKQIELVNKTNFIAQRNEYLEKLKGSCIRGSHKAKTISIFNSQTIYFNNFNCIFNLDYLFRLLYMAVIFSFIFNSGVLNPLGRDSKISEGLC